MKQEETSNLEDAALDRPETDDAPTDRSPELPSERTHPGGLPISRREILLVAGILLFALFLRVIYFVEIKDTPPFHLDEWEHCDVAVYDAQAAHMADTGDWLMEGILRGPDSRYKELGLPIPPGDRLTYPGTYLSRSAGYYFFVAAVYAVFGRSPASIAWVQYFLGLGTLLLLYLCARRLFGLKPAILVLLLACLVPTFMVFESVALRTTVFTFAASLVLLLTLYWLRVQSPWRWLLLGLAVGMLNSLYSIFFPFVLFLCLLKLLQRGKAGETKWALLDKVPPRIRTRLPAVICILAIIVGFQAMKLPFILRDMAVNAKPPIPLKKGDYKHLALILLNSPDVTGEGTVWGKAAVPLAKEARDREDASRWWVLGRLADLHGGWHRFLWFLVGKLRFLLRWPEVPQNVNVYKCREYSVLLRLLPVSFFFITPFALVGMVLLLFQRGGKHRTEVLAALALCAPFLVRIMFGYFSARHRVPLTPLFIMFAVFGLWTLVNLFVHRRLRLGFALLAVLVGITLLTQPIFKSSKSELRPADHLVASTFYVDRKEYPKAREELHKALAMEQMDQWRFRRGEIYRHIGLTYAYEKNHQEAEKWLYKAIQDDPADPKNRRALKWLWEKKQAHAWEEG